MRSVTSLSSSSASLALALPLGLALAACAVDAPASSDAEGEGERLGTVASAATADLTEVTSFGSNPGGLKMWKHVPAAVKPSPATVVVMHGCQQGAVDATKTGWNELSEQYGFVLVFPEQQTANNSVKCFNWGGDYGNMASIQRGKDENLSIKQMVDKALADHGGDPKRVYVAGFSAGAAEALLMAAVYPDVFAAAASVAGIPVYCPASYADVFSCQKPGKSFSADVWAKKVKDAFPGFTGPFPRVSVWQGDADSIVGPANRGEIVKQWAGVHGLSADAPSTTDTVDGQAHSAWKDATGVVKVETYTIAGMDHAVPLKSGGTCGTAGAYAVDKGICASLRIAEFFGLTGATPPASSSSGDAGASSSGKPGASSSSSSSSSSSGGGASSSSSSSGGTNGAAPGDDGYGRAESTCAVSAPGSSGDTALAVFPLAALAGLALGQRRRKTARA